MKLRFLLFATFLTLSLTTFAQRDEAKNDSIFSNNVTAINIDTDNVDDLRNFDWEEMLEFFNENEADQEFKFSIAYQNPDKKEKGKFSYDNFKFSVTGKSKDAEKLLKNTEKVVSKFVKIYDQKSTDKQ
ncbi:hypothetical protein INR75_17520 [Zunongwangia sp. SCSIO 43204]|uniref:hypothetical protein n=1 Tax=Zunongwangia sp. SCSIO 43204 TaxID=2779359 RepID=UPI001CA8F09D|nr:hypothetical protein [Zunongwangia sp. SCSIO 43204]UAB83948.1 hypothetical protein INR75_17520 [Zunongwangia sp. SCSIO 43204]